MGFSVAFVFLTNFTWLLSNMSKNPYLPRAKYISFSTRLKKQMTSRLCVEPCGCSGGQRRDSEGVNSVLNDILLLQMLHNLQ